MCKIISFLMWLWTHCFVRAVGPFDFYFRTVAFFSSLNSIQFAVSKIDNRFRNSIFNCFDANKEALELVWSKSNFTTTHDAFAFDRREFIVFDFDLERYCCYILFRYLLARKAKERIWATVKSLNNAENYKEAHNTHLLRHTKLVLRKQRVFNDESKWNRSNWTNAFLLNEILATKVPTAPNMWI